MDRNTCPHVFNASSILFKQQCYRGEILCEIVKEVIRAVTSAGLQVRVVVCDQDNNNVKAINSFDVSTDLPFFNYQGKRISVIY